MGRRGARGLGAALRRDRALANAARRQRQELVAELGGDDQAPASVLALADLIVRSQILVDTLDAVLLELGSKIVNKRLRTTYPLVEQRQSLADSLAAQLKTFNELKAAAVVEARLRKLEGRDGAL
jgi:hypothetical protein